MSDLSTGAVLLSGAFEHPSDPESGLEARICTQVQCFRVAAKLCQSGFVYRRSFFAPVYFTFVGRRGVFERVFELNGPQSFCKCWVGRQVRCFRASKAPEVGGHPLSTFVRTFVETYIYIITYGSIRVWRHTRQTGAGRKSNISLTLT